MLRENVPWWHAFDQKCAYISDHRREPISGFEGVGGADGDRFLTETGVEATDDFALAEEALKARFELSIELEEIVNFA